MNDGKPREDGRYGAAVASDFLTPDLERNKETVRTMLDEVWNRNDPGAVERYFAAGARGQTEELVHTLRSAFPDLQVRVDDLVAEGDQVVVRLTFRGTHRGPFRGIAATGRTVEFTAARAFRVGNGTIDQTWAEHDGLGILDQLGG